MTPLIYEVSKRVKLIEPKNGIVVARGWRDRKRRSY